MPTTKFFNFADLAELTRASVMDEKLEKTLLHALEQASPDNDPGPAQNRWLDCYIGLLQKGRGLELPAVQSDPMILIGRALRAASQRWGNLTMLPWGAS